MISLRSILTFSVLLLTNNGITLVASQAAPSSLFYERQTQVTTLGGQTATNAGVAISSVITQITEPTSSYTGGSTSSASAGNGGAIIPSITMSNEERKQIEAFRKARENTLKKEEAFKATEKSYSQTWLKTELGPNQKTIAQEIRTATTLPTDLVNLTAQYSYEFRGTCIGTLKGHTETVNALAVLPNGSLASCSSDKSIKIWTRGTGTNRQTTWSCTQKLTEHTQSVSALVVLPDGSLASGCTRGKIKIWKPATNANDQTTWNCTQTLHCTQTLQGHINPITALVVLPDGSLVSGCEDGSVDIWTAADANGQTSWNYTQTVKVSTSGITALVVLPDGSFASGSFDNNIKIWKPATNANGQTTWSCSQELTGHTGYNTCLAVLLNGSLASSSVDGSIKIWTASTGTNNQITWNCTQTILEQGSWIQSLTALPDGSFASGSSDKKIKIWTPCTNTNGQTSWSCTQTLIKHTTTVSALAVLPDGSLVSASCDGDINIWR